MKKLPVVAGVATALVGLSVPVVLMLTDSANALTGRGADDDIERTVSCGQALVELNVDKEGNRFEVDGDVDNAEPGSTWKVVLRHDGDRVLTRTVRADVEGDLDVETLRPNTAGSDVFSFRVKNVDTDAKACKVTVTR
jgi:hypothetical protein